MPSSIWRNLNSMPAISAEARRWWARYLELDSDSEWARRRRRGVQFVDLQSHRENGWLRWASDFCSTGRIDAHRHHPACPWRRRADGFRVNDRGRQGACRGGFSRRPFRVRLHGGPALMRTGRKPPPRAETLNPEYRAAVAELGRRRPAHYRRQVDGRTGRQHGCR